MWEAIASFWTFIGSLASAANNAATAMEKCTKVADQAADTFLIDATNKQAIRKLELAARLARAESGDFSKEPEGDQPVT